MAPDTDPADSTAFAPPGAAPAPPAPTGYRQVLPGDRFPSLEPACGRKPRFAFDNLAGRYQLFCFFLAADHPDTPGVLDAVRRRRELFDDQRCAFAGVSIVSTDYHRRELQNLEPGIRFVWDFDHAVSRACAAAPQDSALQGPTSARRCWVLVDPSLHVLRIFRMGETSADEVLDFVAALPPPDQFGGVSRPAPILMLPNVLEPDMCRRLIDIYEADGGAESGIQRDGQGVLDPSFKRRKDVFLTDPDLLDQLNRRIFRRVCPEVERLFFMQANYIERHIVGCYAAADGGHFAPHRDNGPGLTAHRRFALSVNLNDDFEGGEVVFPEYNTTGYKAPAGWAVVFPCGALHQVRRVTAGARYAYLPFLYDEGGRAIRQAERAQA